MCLGDRQTYIPNLDFKGGVDDPLYAYALKKRKLCFSNIYFSFQIDTSFSRVSREKNGKLYFYVLNRAQQAFVLYLDNY